MKITKLTQELVFEAIEQLKNSGIKVTQSAIRDHFNGIGSNTTINKYIKSYNMVHGEVTTEEVSLSIEINEKLTPHFTALSQVFTTLIDSETTLLNEEILRLSEELSVEQAELERVTSSFTELDKKYSESIEQIKILNTQLSTLKIEDEKRKNEENLAIVELKNTIDTLNTSKFAQDEEVKQLRLTHEENLSVLRQKNENLEKQLSVLETEKSTLETENAAQKNGVQNNLEAMITDLQNTLKAQALKQEQLEQGIQDALSAQIETEKRAIKAEAEYNGWKMAMEQQEVKKRSPGRPPKTKNQEIIEEIDSEV